VARRRQLVAPVLRSLLAAASIGHHRPG